MYLFELPTTGAISFSDFCIDVTPDKKLAHRLQDATQARANIRGLLKESKNVTHADKDNLKLVKLIEEYLPHLLGLMACTSHGEVGLSTDLVFSWRTTLSANLFNSSPRLSVPTFTADLGFVLLTYGFALSNLARAYVAALETYDRDHTMSEADRKSKDEQLGVAVSFLRRASGIFSYISETVLVKWEGGGAPGFKKPPDLTKEVTSALSKMSLADAQNLAIRKLLSRTSYENNIALGSPLPKSHPSPVLLAKLHLECASLYSSGLSLIKNFGASKAISDVHGDVSNDLRRYLTEEATFHGAVAKKWLGIDSGENGGSSKGGEAVAFMAWSKKELEELKDNGISVNLGKADKEQKAEFKNRVAFELNAVVNLLKHYKKLNDTVHFQPVPSQGEVQRCIPAGRLAVQVQPFVSPSPAFGPTSTVGDEHQAVRNGENTDPRPLGTYEGAGAYF
ncbi:pH-response regulator protein palC [Amanita muscaria]